MSINGLYAISVYPTLLFWKIRQVYRFLSFLLIFFQSSGSKCAKEMFTIFITRSTVLYMFFLAMTFCCCFRGDPKIVYLDGVHPPLMTSASRPESTQGSHAKAARYVKQSRHFTSSFSSKLLPQGADSPTPLPVAAKAGRNIWASKKNHWYRRTMSTECLAAHLRRCDSPYKRNAELT